MLCWCRRPCVNLNRRQSEQTVTTIQIDNSPADTPDSRSLDEKLVDLDALFASIEGTVLIGYSGGVDSAMLAVAAHRILGERAIAVTADSESYA